MLTLYIERFQFQNILNTILKNFIGNCCKGFHVINVPVYIHERFGCTLEMENTLEGPPPL